jgi:DNA-binding MarR family transcriptional regulator
VTALEKRLARCSARYREAPPRLRRIRVLRRPGAAPAWPGSDLRATGGARAVSVRESGPDAGSLGADPARRAVSLWLRLLEAHNLILREVRRGMGEAVSLPQFDVLAQLDREPGGLTLTSLSRRLLVSAGNLTGIVARLERGGLVHRDEDPADRRAFRVRLTARGRGLLAGLLPRHAALVRDLFTELPPREQDELRARLARLGDAVVLQAARARHSARGARRDTR